MAYSKDDAAVAVDEESMDVADFAEVPSDYLHYTIPKELLYDFTGKKGLCIIFNHYKYDIKPNTFVKEPKKREGTQHDYDRLQKTFKSLNFDVEPYTDKTYKEIMDIMKEVSERGHSSTSCVVVCVMTHGAEGGKLLASNREYHSYDLFNYLTGDSCPQLARAPKLFFIQACRGGLYDDGVEVDSQRLSCKLPTTANFLIMYSTVENYVAWREQRSEEELLKGFKGPLPWEGSWFIQALCDQILGRYQYMDLLHILTLVNSQVAHTKISRTLKEKSNRKKQMPQIVSTLTKLIKF